MKKILAVGLIALFTATPAIAGMDSGADLWDQKYYKEGTLAGKYGERQIDRDGLDCTPTSVKVAVTLSYVGLTAGIAFAPLIVVGHTASHAVTASYAAVATVFDEDMDEVIRQGSPARTATIRHSGHKITLTPWVGPGLFLLGMLSAMNLSDADAHMKCMVGKGYKGGQYNQDAQALGVRGVPLSQYQSGFGGVK